MSDLPMFTLLNEAEKAIVADFKFSPSTENKSLYSKSNGKAFDKYISILGEGLSASDKDMFESIADIQRGLLVENASPILNPYESLSLPLIRSFWPKLAVRKALHVMPMTTPTLVKYFIKSYAVNNAGARTRLPVIAAGANAPSGSTSLNATVPTPASTDILAAASLTSAVSFIMKGSVKIVGINYLDSVPGPQLLNVVIPVTVDGTFSFTFNASPATPLVPVLETIVGEIDYRAGIIHLSSTRCTQATSKAVSIIVQASAATEYNTLNKKIQIESEKAIIEAKSRPLSAQFSLEFEQDMRALFNLEAQAEIIDIMGQQIATDYEKELVDDIISEIDQFNLLNSNTHLRTFSKTVPVSFHNGVKEWYANSLVDLRTLSAQINNDTNIGAANFIIANPLDTVLLDGLVAGADGTLSAGAYGWTVVQTPVVPQGKMIVNLRPDNERAACYYWSVYKPAEAALGYPSGGIPSLTVMGRYAKKMVRPEGFAILNITA